MPLLCIAEGCERFAATLLAALLALRLNEHWGRTPGEAARAVAWFDALCYGAGLGGAWLADRALGLSRATILGALFLTLGYVALTVDRVPALLLGAGLLLVGHALFKPAVTAWVAAIAGHTASGQIAALRWFYFAINVGTVAGALTAAGLRARCALGAGLGMLAYLIMLGALVRLDAPVMRGTVGHGRVSPLWLLGCEAALTLGELLLIPASMARLARLAHSRGAARAQSATFLAMAMGSGLAGGLAAQWGHTPPAKLFVALASCCLMALLLATAGPRQPGLSVRRP